MDFNEFLTYLFAIPASVIGAYCLIVLLNKKWPFWRDFQWRPVEWRQVGGYFIWAKNAILKRPWLLWIPVALSFLWYSFQTIVIMIVLARRAGPRPVSHLASDYEKLAQIFTPLQNALSSYSIGRLGVTSVEIALVLFLGYFLAYFFNIKRFRQWVFGDDGGGLTVRILHWTALGSGLIAVLWAVHSHYESVGFGSRLWDSFLLIFSHFVYMLPLWPLGVLVWTWVLRMFEGLDGDNLKKMSFQVAPGQFINLFLLFAFNAGIFLLYERVVLLDIFDIFHSGQLMAAFAELTLPLLRFVFIFAGPVIVLKGHGTIPAIRESVRFLMAHAAEMFQIVVISFPILLLAASLGEFFNPQTLFREPEPLLHVRLVMGVIVLPLIQLILQIILALALFHFWYGKKEPVSAESPADITTG